MPILVAIVGLVGIVVAAAIVAVYWKRAGSEASSETRDANWQPPPQTFLASRMDVRPVPGWTARIGDVGLPAGSKFVSSGDPTWSQPLVGNLGPHGFLLAGTPDPAGSQWWLIGVDARTGGRVFAPVRLDAATASPKCFLNGSDAVLCLRDGDQSGTAWVVDARSGAVVYSGPTDLRTSPGALHVTQVGSYAVAETTGQGVFGIGPRAETTWFVPGKGQTNKRRSRATNVEPQALATQDVGGDQTSVFSLVDGKVVSPELDAGLSSMSAVTYPGGFAVEVVASQSNSIPDGIEFFDETGKKLGRADVSGFLSTSSMDIPIVASAPESVVFSPAGKKLADISRFEPGDTAILIGSVLFVGGPSFDHDPQPYDLSTGAKGKACKVTLSNYVATDGKVGIFESDIPNVGLVTKAMNLATCDTLWSIDSPVGSFRAVWRIDTSLVQLSDDGTELTSLVAPS